MSFTGAIGTANSMPGNLVPGFGGSLAPVYLGSAGLLAGPGSLHGAATFVTPVFTAAAALGTGPAVLHGAAGFTLPVYTGTAPGLMAGGAVLNGQALSLANCFETMGLISNMYAGGY